MLYPVEIVCVGNELLIGKVLNTNAQWLAKRITALGLSVRRINTVGDDVDEISSAMREAIQRNPSFIITTGGLGPTFDDKTLEGVAKALGCPLEFQDGALGMVEGKYRRFVEEGRMERLDLTPPRLKMAKLPKGADPLFNPVGTAPGVIMKHNETTIIALPGVPSEMMAIFEDSVVPLLKRATGDVTFFEASLYVTGVMESDLAPLIDRVMHENPYVYIKSHPRGAEKVPHIELHLSTTAEDSSVAKSRVSKALTQISEMIQTKGGKTKPT
ncbi:MAG: competence damage-inducible protein A [Candidatus Bathyarchaeota archaeon BA1]|nr:MAG: competence damage-inducible protein A [Candidatus Bathyarchaeota archaeon BA1]